MLCVAGLPSAHADGKDEYVEGKSAVVKFADLNLQSPAGAEELYRRIQRAATKVCWEPTDPHVLSSRDRRDCVERAVAKAVGDVNNGYLTALYTRKTNKAFG
jgi:UrcA family protein